jgi:hypothetical protein
VLGRTRRGRALAVSVAGGLLLAACTRAATGTPYSPGASRSEVPDASTSPIQGGTALHFYSGIPGPSALPASGGPASLIPLSLIISGGPPPDGIPPIDHPKFEAPARATFLADDEPILSVTYHGRTKAYPLRILIWHEVVNDTIGGTPVVVTFCPLCNTGIAYLRPTVQGHLLDFGTSGKLYDSNLLMYDRQTRTLWSQALGKAVAGQLTGTKLPFVPAQILSWRDWRETYPDGLVLTADTGVSRPYGSNPYVNYDSSSQPFLFQQRPDPRLPATEHVLGIESRGKTEAFPFSRLAELSSNGWTAVNSSVGGRDVVVFWEEGTASALDAASIANGRDIGAAAAYIPRAAGRRLTFSVTADGIVDDRTGSRWDLSGLAGSGPLAGARRRPAVAIDSFWFDWAAFHPNTGIYGG